MNRRTLATFLSLFLASACMVVTTRPAPAPSPQPQGQMTPAAPSAAATPSPSGGVPCNPGATIVNATLWMETAAEYQASARQVYSAAHRTLDAALADKLWSALPTQTSAATLPPAVILDLDETALDNMAFESRAIRAGTTYATPLWKQWVSESAAGTIPGAADFLAYAKSRGVTPFYITNRDPDEKAATRTNLEKVGFPLSASEETLLVRGERPEWKTSDKTGRRQFVASTHRVLMLFGDDLNDFVFATGKSRVERDTLVRQYDAYWGVKWFILPNPIYGSWEKALTSTASGADECEKKLNSLR